MNEQMTQVIAFMEANKDAPGFAQARAAAATVSRSIRVIEQVVNDGVSDEQDVNDGGA